MLKGKGAIMENHTLIKKREHICVLISSWLRESELTPLQFMLASEPVLAKEWDTPEEDEIWADL